MTRHPYKEPNSTAVLVVVVVSVIPELVVAVVVPVIAVVVVVVRGKIVWLILRHLRLQRNF